MGSPGTAKRRSKVFRVAYEDAGTASDILETIVKEKKIFITDTYESYVGKEFPDGGKAGGA